MSRWSRLLSSCLIAVGCARAQPRATAPAAPGPGPTAPPPAAGPAPPPVAAVLPSDAELDRAIDEMRGVQPERLSQAERDRKDAALDRAWRTLKMRPAPARQRLRAALAAAVADHQDDFFRADGASLLWQLGALDELEAVAAALDGADLAAHFDVIFPLLTSAAHTRDARAWPLLRQGLRADPRTTAFIADSSLRVAWPMVLDFMFAPYGPDLCRALGGEAERASAPAVARSLTFLLARNLCLEGLPFLRRSAEGGGPLAVEALRALGRLAHPDDEQRLVRAAASPDPEIRRSAAYALYELDDPATAPTLRRLLADPREEVRIAAMAGVFHLLDPAGAAALIAHAAKLGGRGGDERGSKEADQYDKLLEAFAEASYSDAGELRRGDRGAWREAVGRYRSMRDTLFVPRPGDRRLSRPELERAFEEWEREGRLAGSAFAWVEPRHLLAVARPADIPRMLSVRGALCAHPSEAALAEVEAWDRLLAVLNHRRVGAGADKLR
jgi:hypothetical protein